MKIEDISVDKVVKEYYETKKQKRNYDFSKLIKRTYMPYSEKCALVKNIVDATSYIEVSDEKMYQRNTLNMLFVFTMKIIEEYTYLVWESGEVVSSYDKLMESGVMNHIMENIPEEEIKILHGMLDMQRDDVEANTRSLVSFFETKFKSLNMSLGALEDILQSPEMIKRITENNK